MPHIHLVFVVLFISLVKDNYPNWPVLLAKVHETEASFAAKFCSAAASLSVASIAMANAYGHRSLEDTPTWAVATVCVVFVIVSITIEHGIRSLGMWFQRHQKKAMVEALDKIKAELMLFGFMSLLITVGTKPISKICISAEAADTTLPCKKDLNAKYNKDGYDPYLCGLQGKVPLISQPAVHQLHIFLFVPAVFHVLYSVGTMALGQAKMKKWKGWEMETTSFECHCTNDPSRFRLTHQISFARRHTGLSTSPGFRWIVGFFRQFFASVTKVDYLTMRHGFINAHVASNSKFDFHKYIKRSMEDDFKAVVGISMPLWASAIIFQLLNVYRWYTLSWISCVPLATLLLVGAKLEVIIMEMAKDIRERATVVKGAPVNAFQMAYFLWIWYEFGLSSCFHEKLPATVARVLFGVALQVVCSYITFPLYALVTQMGSHMKKAIFEEQTAKALKKWQQTARERTKVRRTGLDVSIQLMGGHNTPSRGSSPIQLLHKHKPRASDIGGVIHSPK